MDEPNVVAVQTALYPLISCFSIISLIIITVGFVPALARQSTNKSLKNQMNEIGKFFLNL